MKPAMARPASRARCRRGTTATEFAIIFPAFIVAVIAVVEVGWQMTVAAALDRATLRAARFGVTGQASAGSDGPACRSQSIPWVIVNSTGGVLHADRLTVTLGAAGSPSALAGGTTAGAGQGGEIVTYTVTYTQPFLSAAWLNLVGGPAQLVHQTFLAVKNEAFDDASC